MLSGEYQHSIDAKGRLIMPSKLRDELGETCVITKGYEGCIFIYSPSEWDKFSAKLTALPQSNPKARRLVRMFTSGAVVSELDKQGRVLIPSVLRDYAKIEKDVTIIGTLDKLEVWDTDAWNAYNDMSDMTLEEAAQGLEEFGF